MDALASWVGRQERAQDDIGATPIAAFAALLDREPVRPAAGAALPPVDLPRRMWAASPSVAQGDTGGAAVPSGGSAQWRREVRPFYVCGRRDGARASLWIEDVGGALCMDAAAEIE